MERVRGEVQERISRRQGQLEEELREYNSAVETELQRVGEQVQAYEALVTGFFEQLLQGTDPVIFATMAAKVPDSPAFGDPDPAALVHDLRMSRSPAVQADSLPVPDQTPEVVPDHWWLDSPASIAADPCQDEPWRGGLSLGRQPEPALPHRTAQGLNAGGLGREGSIEPPVTARIGRQPAIRPRGSPQTNPLNRLKGGT